MFFEIIAVYGQYQEINVSPYMQKYDVVKHHLRSNRLLIFLCKIHGGGLH